MTDQDEDGPDRSPPSGRGKRNDVGYCRPPREHQFQRDHHRPGPGRTPGRKDTATLLAQEAQVRVVVTENGRRRTMTRAQIAARRNSLKAAEGDHRAREVQMRSEQTVENRKTLALPTARQVTDAADRLTMASVLARIRALPQATSSAADGSEDGPTAERAQPAPVPRPDPSPDDADA